ncbi:MAG: YggS family pyridoxal phosphate-dependent enzyme [Planctomycetales bacterium]
MSSETVRPQISENLASVRARIAESCARCGRKPEEVQLVAVVKYAEIEWIRELVALGVTTLAENRPQQLVERVPLFPEAVQWHMIGHLQTNKVRRVLPLVKLIHAVDSVKLLSSIERIAGEEDLSPEVLLEINVSRETSKQGFSPEELRNGWDEIGGMLERTTVRGLMTMAPLSENPEDARQTFAGLRNLRDELQQRGKAGKNLRELSMGMTGDFEVAIEEGATFVRIGSALFEGL